MLETKSELNAGSWFEVSEKPKPLARLRGEWRVQALDSIDRALASLNFPSARDLTIDCSELEQIDTAGAMFLRKLLANLGYELSQVSFQNLRSEHLDIIQLVQDSCPKLGPHAEERSRSMLEVIGESTFDFFSKLAALLAFIGHTLFEFSRVVFKPSLMRWKELFVQLELCFINAIGIVILVNFLIGVVIAYLFAVQIEQYGANIFIVDAVSLAMCRELSPILVAILVAGRSGSAFTAQIGTMKLNEEIDALLTLGLSPMHVLVLPRFLALVLTMPLLVFLGDVVGIFGGLLVADLRLGVTGLTFVERLQSVLSINSVYVGMIKAPVFAAFISVIGCRMGFSVENNARSVGAHTTSTVVQSIVSVILLNAAFAILFVELGI